MENVGLITVIIILGGSLFGIVVPVVLVNIQESYQISVPYDVQVEYTERALDLI